MADYPFTHGKYKGTMASEMYKKKSYTEWAMSQETSFDSPINKFKLYVEARRCTESRSSPVTPCTPVPTTPPHDTAVEAATSPEKPGADMRLHQKLNRMERKIDIITELLQGLLSTEHLATKFGEPSMVTLEDTEPSALATLS